MVLVKFSPLVAGVFVAATVSAIPRVDPGVHRALRQQGKVDLIITTKAGVDTALATVRETDHQTRADMIAAMIESLESHAKTTHSSIDVVLAQEAAGQYESQETFWITNQKVIKGATPELVQKLAKIPELAHIREEVVFSIPTFESAGNSTHNESRVLASTLANEWGVAKIGAPSVWAAGYRGQNVVIRSLGTGVCATHSAIAGKLRNTHNWFDATAGNTTPYDDVGLGTHAIGTLVGGNGLGVAPDARVIVCKGIRTDSTTETELNRCAQFLTCPTTPTGDNKDCSKAPRIITNSWVGPRGYAFFAQAIKSWRAANIIPVFATGNTGPNCATATHPADDDRVIAVGATTSADRLADFSSKGPALNGAVKPDISAPGENIRSAWNSNDNAFNSVSQTTAAASHVAGVIALVLSKKPSLTFDQVKAAITNSAERASLASSGNACGGTKDTTYPNNQYGYGRINALKAINSV